jgi:sterol desaturase/sphingolipid hydroxylase (fatty acid hydroxylase superfamily)
MAVSEAAQEPLSPATYGDSDVKKTEAVKEEPTTAAAETSQKMQSEQPEVRPSGPADVAMAAAACLVWPCICILPLVLTAGRDSAAYRLVFPAAWYDEAPRQPPRGAYGIADPRDAKPLGLILGIAAVAVGQVFVLAYHALRRGQWLGPTWRVQKQERTYNFFEGMVSHLSQPEGFLLIGGYLVGTWMLGLMPASYYSFAGGINWVHVFAQLLLQDLLQYVMHLGEHKVSNWVYRNSHKPHHRFTNPRVFDAFDGSLADTSLMIVVPFIFVARAVPANVWSYMCFGSLYANWLVLIHSEFYHPWDPVFKMLGFGTPGDHHVHHRFFVFNFGHLFMYWDKLLGTYRDPRKTPKEIFNHEPLKA